jgi:hypothetical protein
MLTSIPEDHRIPGRHKGDTVMRGLVLASVYAGAVLFAVMFSPEMGFVKTPSRHLLTVASETTP